MGSKHQPRRELALYLHQSSRDRLFLLAKVLNAPRTSVIAQAISRWALSAKGSKWIWYVEEPLRISKKVSRASFRVCAKLPVKIGEYADALAETLHLPLSAVVEQALLRWCREEPFVNVSASEPSESQTGEEEEGLNNASHTRV